MTIIDTPERREPGVEPVEDLPDPWEGIPAALLEAAHGYDTDSAGGCG